MKTLKSSRLTYRQFKESDYESLCKILTHPVVCKYLPGETYTEVQVEKWLRFFINSFSIDKKNLIYAVCDQKGNMIGYCGCAFIPEYQCNEIKYFLHPKYFNKGYGTEMGFRMKEVAKDLGLTFLVGLADIDNVGSQKILEKIGFVYQNDVELWGSKLKYYELEL